MAFSDEKDAGASPEANRAPWDDARRRAAIQELENRFQMCITEQEVFQAAALFFGLLRDGVFIDKGAVAQRMRREAALAGEADAETSGRRP